jgi:hypothetical protein
MGVGKRIFKYTELAIMATDPDQELYQKICEVAKAQNMHISTFQRGVLCHKFNIPDNTASVQWCMIEKVIMKIAAVKRQNRKIVVRNMFREYFGMPTKTDAVKMPLMQTHRCFEVLSFLVVVDAATKYEINLKMGRNVSVSLTKNPWYFERFTKPYDRRIWWRVTEQGKNEYFAVMSEKVGNIPNLTQKDLSTLVSVSR